MGGLQNVAFVKSEMLAVAAFSKGLYSYNFDHSYRCRLIRKIDSTDSSTTQKAGLPLMAIITYM